MNYEKRRKRQSGRQKRKGVASYMNGTHEWNRLHTEIDRLIKDGLLPTINYNPSAIKSV